MRFLKNIMNKPIKLITHDGVFHCDDIFSAATLQIYLDKKGEIYEMTRTRDEQIIKNGDFVFDVGGIHDEKNNRFDHHQVGGAGRRVPSESEGKTTIEYASFGLVWKKFGLEICGDQRVVDLIDKKLVAPVDAGDNGFDLIENKYDVSPYLIQHAFGAMRPTWREEELTEDEMFLKSVEIAKEILAREIIQASDGVLAEDLVVSAYKSAQDKRIIVLDKNYLFEYTLNNFTEPLFVVRPRKVDGTWGAKAVREDPKTFKNRKNFPKTWAGLRDDELQNITGVRDAVFCHRGLFLAVAKSKEGAIKLAELALIG